MDKILMLESFQDFVTEWEWRRQSSALFSFRKGVFATVLCLVNNDGLRGVFVTGDRVWLLDEVVAVIGGNADVTLEAVRELLDRGVIAQRPDGAVVVPFIAENEERKRKVRERVKRNRNGACNANVTGDVTPLVTMGDIRGNSSSERDLFQGKKRGVGRGKGKPMGGRRRVTPRLPLSRKSRSRVDRFAVPSKMGDVGRVEDSKPQENAGDHVHRAVGAPEPSRRDPSTNQET